MIYFKYNHITHQKKRIKSLVIKQKFVFLIWINLNCTESKDLKLKFCKTNSACLVSHFDQNRNSLKVFMSISVNFILKKKE